jgi:hypothetical protein
MDVIGLCIILAMMRIVDTGMECAELQLLLLALALVLRIFNELHGLWSTVTPLNQPL